VFFFEYSGYCQDFKPLVFLSGVIVVYLIVSMNMGPPNGMDFGMKKKQQPQNPMHTTHNNNNTTTTTHF